MWLDVFWFYFDSVTWFLLCTVSQVSWLRPHIFRTIIFIISTVIADHYLPKVYKINHNAMFWKVVLRLLSWILTDLYLMVYLFLLILLIFFMTGVHVLIMISSIIFWCILLRPWIDGDEILEKAIKVLKNESRFQTVFLNIKCWKLSQFVN